MLSSLLDGFKLNRSIPLVQLDGAKHDSIYHQVSVSYLLPCPAFLLISNKNSLILIVNLNPNLLEGLEVFKFKY